MHRGAVNGAQRRLHFLQHQSIKRKGVVSTPTTQNRHRHRHHRPGKCFSSAASASQPPPAPSSSSSSSPPSSGSEIYQQLSFCCLVCGWETPCTSCPFDWYGFDPRKHRRRTHAHARHRSSATELQDACATLDLDGASAKSLTPQEIKAAFRKKALEWHPDCSAHENAEATFKEIVLAYELLAATFPSS